MPHFIPFIIAILLTIVSCKLHPEAKLHFMEYCHYFNYPVEKHLIETDDGYILTYYRVQKKNSQINEGLKPIWLQHGLLGSSDDWITNDEDKSPAWILANAGYDVWIGNSRGNKHSLDHIRWTTKNMEFWAFTFQHMADYDIPAGFKYIYAKTGQKINYIGHSQGTIQMFIALSKNNPIVESLLDNYFAFGPVAFANHQTSKLLHLLSDSKILPFLQKNHIYQVLSSPNWIETQQGILFCSAFEHICADFIGMLSDTDPKIDNYERMDVFDGHQPSGTSTLNFIHWDQLTKGPFRAFDYGSDTANMIAYNQTKPPIWNLKNIRVKVRLYGGLLDKLADPYDLNNLWSNLSAGAQQYYKLYQKTGHMTFLMGLNTTPWMSHVLSVLQSPKVQSQQNLRQQ